MKKIFSIIMLAAAVSLVTLSACGDASGDASADTSDDSNASADLRMIFFLFVNTVLIRISDYSRSCIFVYFIQSYWQINYFIYSFYFNYLIESIINWNYHGTIPSSLNSWI